MDPLLILRNIFGGTITNKPGLKTLTWAVNDKAGVLNILEYYTSTTQSRNIKHAIRLAHVKEFYGFVDRIAYLPASPLHSE